MTVIADQNKDQNGDRSFWRVFRYKGKSPTGGGGDGAVGNAPASAALPHHKVFKALIQLQLYKMTSR